MRLQPPEVHPPLLLQPFGFPVPQLVQPIKMIKKNKKLAGIFTMQIFRSYQSSIIPC